MEKNSAGSVGVTWLITFGEDEIDRGCWQLQHCSNSEQYRRCNCNL